MEHEARFGVETDTARLRPARRLFALTALLALAFVIPFSSASAADYQGNVGRMQAEFSLDWHEDRSVTGSYRYPARPGIVYGLSGSNPREGELELFEFTGERLTARCFLRKRIEAGAVVWEGEMRNLDGRVLPIRFERARDVPAADWSDDYEKRRAAILEKAEAAPLWETFPFAGATVERVPVDPPDSEPFAARIEAYVSNEVGSILVFTVGNWDAAGNLAYDGPRVALTFLRPLPIPPERLVGRETRVTFDSDGRLLDADLANLAVTHVRKGAGGELEIRAFLEPPYDPAFEPAGDARAEARFREATLAADPVVLLPDKLGLAPGFESASDLGFRTLRIVEGYGLVVQSTDAGPGALELESMSLEPSEAADWIPVDQLEESFEIPASQRTEEAG